MVTLYVLHTPLYTTKTGIDYRCIVLWYYLVFLVVMMYLFLSVSVFLSHHAHHLNTATMTDLPCNTIATSLSPPRNHHHYCVYGRVLTFSLFPTFEVILLMFVVLYIT